MFKTDQEFILSQSKDFDALPTLDQKIRRFIDIGVEIYLRNAELRSKLQNIQTYLTDESFYNSTMKAYQELVMRQLPPLPGRDPQVVVYIVVTAFVGLMDRAVLEVKDLGKNKAFTDEAYRLFYNYLAK
jgi:hypothetical protein